MPPETERTSGMSRSCRTFLAVAQNLSVSAEGEHGQILPARGL